MFLKCFKQDKNSSKLFNIGQNSVGAPKKKKNIIVVSNSLFYQYFFIFAPSKVYFKFFVFILITSLTVALNDNSNKFSLIAIPNYIMENKSETKIILILEAPILFLPTVCLHFPNP